MGKAVPNVVARERPCRDMVSVDISYEFHEFTLPSHTSNGRLGLTDNERIQNQRLTPLQPVSI